MKKVIIKYEAVMELEITPEDEKNQEFQDFYKASYEEKSKEILNAICNDDRMVHATILDIKFEGF